MPLPPPVIKIVLLVSFIVKYSAPNKDAQLPSTSDTIHRTVSISPSGGVHSSVDRRIPPAIRGLIHPDRFGHLPRDPECDGCARSSSQGANPIFKPLRFHRHQLRITRPVGQDRYSL